MKRNDEIIKVDEGDLTAVFVPFPSFWSMAYLVLFLTRRLPAQT